MAENLLTTIRQEISDFENNEIQVVPGFLFNQKETLERIYRYFYSKFEDGEIDYEGDKKYFYNICRTPCLIYTKSIDFDTKHIRPITEEGQNPFKTWLLERDLRYYFKKVQFGKVLNRIFKELPIFGSVVLKIIDNKPYFVDLRNFVCCPSADTLDNSPYIIEIHRFSLPRFLEVAKEKGWDKSKVDEIVEKTPSYEFIKIYERYGLVDGEYKRVIMADVRGEEEEQEAGIVLDETVVDRHPYYEFHLEKIPGRWLGVGVVEILFDPQVRQNEIANMEAKGSYWNALRVFQTRDTTVERNLMKDVMNGEILNIDSEITPVNTTDPNLAFFAEQTRKWLQNRDELSFSYDVIRGERLPAGTPLGSAQLAASMVMSHFDQIREEIAMDIKELIFSVILPNFQKTANQEHILRLVGEDIEVLKNLLVREKTFKSAIIYAVKNRRLPPLAYLRATKIAIQERFKEKKELSVVVPKDFYKDLKYSIDIVITGESKDTAVFAQTLFTAIQAITADRTLLSDPVRRKLFFKYLESGGINPSEFFPVEQEQELPIQREVGGGGVSRPVSPVALPAGERTV